MKVCGCVVNFGVDSVFVNLVLPDTYQSWKVEKPNRINEIDEVITRADIPRQILKICAWQIARNNNAKPVSKLTALRKLFIQERRNRSLPGNPRVGWKRGEIFEVIEAALFHRDKLAEEWGDIGYYLAQSYKLLWTLYKAVTPFHIIERACSKYVERARKGGSK